MPLGSATSNTGTGSGSHTRASSQAKGRKGDPKRRPVNLGVGDAKSKILKAGKCRGREAVALQPGVGKGTRGRKYSINIQIPQGARWRRDLNV